MIGCGKMPLKAVSHHDKFHKIYLTNLDFGLLLPEGKLYKQVSEKLKDEEQTQTNLDWRGETLAEGFRLSGWQWLFQYG